MDILTVPFAKRILPNCFFDTVKSLGTGIKPVELHMKEDYKTPGQVVEQLLVQLNLSLGIDGHGSVECSRQSRCEHLIFHKNIFFTAKIIKMKCFFYLLIYVF